MTFSNTENNFTRSRDEALESAFFIDNSDFGDALLGFTRDVDDWKANGFSMVAESMSFDEQQELVDGLPENVSAKSVLKFNAQSVDTEDGADRSLWQLLCADAVQLAASVPQEFELEGALGRAREQYFIRNAKVYKAGLVALTSMLIAANVGDSSQELTIGKNYRVVTSKDGECYVQYCSVSNRGGVSETTQFDFTRESAEWGSQDQTDNDPAYWHALYMDMLAAHKQDAINALLYSGWDASDEWEQERYAKKYSVVPNDYRVALTELTEQTRMAPVQKLGSHFVQYARTDIEPLRRSNRLPRELEADLFNYIDPSNTFEITIDFVEQFRALLPENKSVNLGGADFFDEESVLTIEGAEPSHHASLSVFVPDGIPLSPIIILNIVNRDGGSRASVEPLRKQWQLWPEKNGNHLLAREAYRANGARITEGSEGENLRVTDTEARIVKDMLSSTTIQQQMQSKITLMVGERQKRQLQLADFIKDPTIRPTRIDYDERYQPRRDANGAVINIRDPEYQVAGDELEAIIRSKEEAIQNLRLVPSSLQPFDNL